MTTATNSKLAEAEMLLMELNEASKAAIKATEEFYRVSDEVELFLRDAIGNE